MKIRNIVLGLSLCLMATGCDACGNSSVNNELVGQPKRLHNETPIVCENRVDLDISLGFMKDGVGSVSTHDTHMTVPNPKDVETLNRAINENKLVKVYYNEARFNWCWQDQVIIGVEVLEK